MNFVRQKITVLLALSLTLVTIGVCQNAQHVERTGDERGVAVLPFEIRGLTPDEGMRLRGRFTEALAESRRFEILPDDAFKSLLANVGLTKIDSCNTVACLAQLGKILHVEKVVQVSADRWDQRYILHIRLVNAADGKLLYDERVDYSGDFNTLLTTIAPDQGRKLAAAFLDKKPDWLLIGAAVLVGVGLIYWLFKTFGSMDSSVPQGNQPVGPAQ